MNEDVAEGSDRVELVAVAEPLLDHGASCKLTKRLRITRDSKYEHALSLANGFARRYLEPKPRKKRGGSAKGRSTPALDAAWTIAGPGHADLSGYPRTS